TGDREVSAAEAEALDIATLVAFALKHSDQFPVFDRKNRCFRQLEAADIALLYRSSTHADLFEEALHKMHIPCMRAEERGFFARPEITDLVALLKWLTAPDDSAALVTVLRSPLFNVDETSLYKALADSRREKTSQREKLLFS